MGLLWAKFGVLEEPSSGLCAKDKELVRFGLPARELPPSQKVGCWT